jgi:4a-hydroxytetrahydrobiopterin dehydratase
MNQTAWREENSTLIREFEFADFKTALEFVNKVGQLAEAANHHPDIELGWGRVKVSLTTHSEGKVTDKDHRLASQIDQIKK